MSEALVVGLTGGIGSGKSAVCREFERLGVPIVDADIASREVVAPGTAGLRAVVRAFGSEVLNDEGTIDRTNMRQLIFEDESKRKTLETILHPLIRERISTQLSEVRSPYCILCVPLLVEKRGYENLDRILVIDCPIEIQIARVMARDSLSRAQVEAIMQTQASRAQRLHLADDIVENAAGLDSLRDPVTALHAKYLLIAEQQMLERKTNEHRNRSPKHTVPGG
ncbi:MAG: dephospho-CoA kinase [Gammaproteobacteria bacterium]|jgi:dephospho-CoA kinase